MEITGIYRDIWERNPLKLAAADIQRTDVCNTLNYPTMEEFLQAQERARSRERAKDR
jgi:hypothetical protein